MDAPKRLPEPCARCGDDTGPGTALYVDRVIVDGRVTCNECAQAERGHAKPVFPEPDVPITMPNTNLPSTH
jgi:hypothetical protein